MIAICVHSALLLLLFLLIFLLFLRKPLQTQRRFEKILLSILIVLFSLLGARHTPNLENLVLRYTSPESAFQYLGRGDYIGTISGENEVVAVPSGNSNSALRLSVSGDRYCANALPLQTSSATFEDHEKGSIVIVTLIPSQKAGAYYVVIRLFSKTPVTVSDAYGSDFGVFSSANSPSIQYYTTYLPSLQEPYLFTVDESPYLISPHKSSFEKFREFFTHHPIKSQQL